MKRLKLKEIVGIRRRVVAKVNDLMTKPIEEQREWFKKSIDSVNKNRKKYLSKQPIPVVGMGATILCYSDRVAATIINISKGGKRLTVQHDKSTRIDENGMSDQQEYKHERWEKGSKVNFSLRKNGVWKNTESGNLLMIGHRNAYYDYSF